MLHLLEVLFMRNRIVKMHSKKQIIEHENTEVQCLFTYDKNDTCREIIWYSLDLFAFNFFLRKQYSPNKCKLFEMSFANTEHFDQTTWK